MEKNLINKVKLFCFPYAGGSSYIYSKWKKGLDPRIDLQLIELAGRGERLSDKQYQDIYEAIDDLYIKVKGKLNESPVMLFGYSMGSLLTYEIAKKLQCDGTNELAHIFVAAKNPPYCGTERILSDLGEKEFKEMLLIYGGTPKEILDNSDASRYFLPILRNDFKLVETYKVNREKEKLNCNLTVMYGSQDSTVKAGEMIHWADYTSGSCKEIIFNGDHFFMLEEWQGMIHIINQTVDCYFRSTKLEGSCV